MKKRLSVLLSIIIVLSICAPLTSVMAEEARKQSVLKTGKEIAALCNEYDNYSNSNDGDKIDNRLIVKTNDNIDKYGAIDSVYGFGYAFLQYADEKSAQKAKENYEESGYTADYDCVVTSSSTYDKYNTNEEWAYEDTDAVSALDYYKLKAKSNINIAVVDSGINYNHELFKNRIERTKVDFSTDASGDERDTSGHGTKVAGAIAKSTPSNVKLFAYKIFNKNLKGTSSEAVAALSYIKQLKNKPDIINCSFSTGSLGTVIDELVDMGVTVVAAAGNDGKEIYQQPAIFDSVITVAATNQYGYAWSSSSYGSCVDISAPGVGVYTANFPGNNTYAQFAGTSMATPLVSAAAAYVLMEHRSYTPEQVKQEIIATATPFKKSDCYNDRYGAGIVNFSNIINGTRCKDVTANYISGAYRDSISVELKCANTLADIYYTTDGTLPSKTNGTKYTEPIKLTETTRITAVAFANCTSLTDKADFSSVERVDETGLAYTYFKTINLPECTNIGQLAFEGSKAENIIFGKLERTSNAAFYNCSNLKKLYIPKVKSFSSNNTRSCNSIELIFAPSVKYLTLDVTHDINVYCDLLLSAQIENPSKYNCNIITQSYAPGLKDVDSSLYNHISSDDFGVSKAGEYRRSDARLRFGFTFDSSKIGFDFNEFAQNTEYGFVYSYNDFSGVSDSSKKERLRANESNSLIKSADNRIVDGTVSTYNAVFTDIPAESAADGISVRSYFCIDGMYFYSPVVTYSLSSVSDYSDNSEADNDIKYDHIHSYVKKNIGPFCVTKGYTMYECNGCGKSYIVDYIEPVGHKYKFVDAKNGLLNYQCPYCDNNITKSKSELPIFIDYVNTKAARGNDNMYLDLNNDGYINAKDYALLNKISN